MPISRCWKPPPFGQADLHSEPISTPFPHGGVYFSTINIITQPFPVLHRAQASLGRSHSCTCDEKTVQARVRVVGLIWTHTGRLGFPRPAAGCLEEARQCTWNPQGQRRMIAHARGRKRNLHAFAHKANSVQRASWSLLLIIATRVISCHAEQPPRFLSLSLLSPLLVVLPSLSPPLNPSDARTFLSHADAPPYLRTRSRAAERVETKKNGGGGGWEKGQEWGAAQLTLGRTPSASKLTHPTQSMELESDKKLFYTCCNEHSRFIVLIEGDQTTPSCWDTSTQDTTTEPKLGPCWCGMVDRATVCASIQHQGQ